MDPDATLQRYWESLEDGDLNDAAEAYNALRAWLERGGFEPDWDASGHTRAEFIHGPHLPQRTKESATRRTDRRRAKFFIHTRSGFPKWVCVGTAMTKSEAESEVERLRHQDDPMWATAEYLITDTRTPSSSTPANVAEAHRPNETEARRGGPQRQQRAGSFVVTLSTGQTARFHDMPRAQAWATERLTGQPPGTYATFYRAAVGPGRSDTGAPWTEPFHVLVVDEYGRIRVGDTHIVSPLPTQHPYRSLADRPTEGLHRYHGGTIEMSGWPGHWSATVRFKQQEKDFYDRTKSYDELLQMAKDWIDDAPEHPRDFYGKPIHREAQEEARRSAHHKIPLRRPRRK